MLLNDPTNKIIAYELALSEGTVKIYLTEICRLIGVRNRTELATWAFQEFETARGAGQQPKGE